MDKDKVGNFIKKLRKKYNLTQSDIADKYNVTYQSVSKWENGINLPSLSLLKQMSKDYNIDITDILDGEFSSKKHNKNNLIFIIIIIFFLTLISFFIILKITKKDNFVFKTISTDCKDFNVSGSIAYDKDKSFIHISNVKYCGINDETLYKKIEAFLYEKDKEKMKKIFTYKSKETIKIKDYLQDLQFKIDNYNRICKDYNQKNLFLEIDITDNNNKTYIYKIPLKLNNNC